jgi:aryl-alcohol dehydrogenase-like predicted oxidoreductase
MNAIDISRLSLGTAQFGLTYGIANQSGVPDLGELSRIVRVARARGIRSLDTAHAYGDAEVRLGNVGVDGFRITTKVGGQAGLVERLLVSLNSLGLESVETVLLHEELALLGPNASSVYAELEEARASGLVRQIGVSVYSPECAYEIMTKFKIDVIQAPVNIIDRRFVEEDFVGILSERNVKLQARSVFLQGLLVDPKASSKLPEWIESEVLEDWFSWISQQERSAVELALDFVLGCASVDTVVFGVDHAQQLEQIIDYARMPRRHDFPIFKAPETLLDPRRWQ